MVSKFKALIVDDEELARRDLRAILGAFEKVEVVGEADCISSALELIEKFNPNLIFLDIQMPGESGFDLLDKIDSHPFVVFVTAFDKYAIRAFEVNAKDYLLKPVNPERLTQTLERIELEVPNSQEDFRKLEYDDVIFLMLNNKYKFLKVNTILAITAAADYTEVHTTDGHRGITQKTMKEWELRLPENYFSRIHRSTIINIELIENIEEWFNYSYRIYLKGIAKPFVMSRRYAAKIKNLLG
ncbi:MAG: LytTR family DNA-binding domain-containing protein [Ignavibacteriales bacterium]|nr:LytTR family DNA-binding domain-containing protein [Ignavibacteriales bacterium]